MDISNPSVWKWAYVLVLNVLELRTEISLLAKVAVFTAECFNTFVIICDEHADYVFSFAKLRFVAGDGNIARS